MINEKNSFVWLTTAGLRREGRKSMTSSIPSSLKKPKPQIVKLMISRSRGRGFTTVLQPKPKTLQDVLLVSDHALKNLGPQLRSERRWDVCGHRGSISHSQDRAIIAEGKVEDPGPVDVGKDGVDDVVQRRRQNVERAPQGASPQWRQRQQWHRL